MTCSAKWVIGLAAFALHAPFAGASGCPAVMDPVWQLAVEAAQETLSGAVTASSESISQVRANNLRQVQSAFKVLAAQIHTAGDTQSQAIIQGGSAIATQMVALSQYKQQTLRSLEYAVPAQANDINGQGIDPCGETARSAAVATAVAASNDALTEKVIREIDAAPGKVVADNAIYLNRRVNAAKSRYCTQEEAAAGFCAAPGPLAGQDVDVANFFSSQAINSERVEAKNALLNHLYGIPSPAPPRALIKGAVGQNFFAAKRREDAVRSVGQTSMKSIQAWTESRGEGPSVMEAISQKVGTYAGGDNFQAWADAKAVQSEHGLLVDYAKMKAFELSLRNLEYQQMERIEANVAAILAVRAARLKTSSTALQDGVARGRIGAE